MRVELVIRKGVTDSTVDTIYLREANRKLRKDRGLELGKPGERLLNSLRKRRTGSVKRRLVLPLSSVVENSVSHRLKLVYSEVFAVNVWKSKISAQRILRKGDMGGWPTLDGGSTVDPAGEGDQQELPWVERAHGGRC